MPESPRWDRLSLDATLATFVGTRAFGLIEHGALAIHHGEIARVGAQSDLVIA